MDGFLRVLRVRNRRQHRGDGWGTGRGAHFPRGNRFDYCAFSARFSVQRPLGQRGVCALDLFQKTRGRGPLAPLFSVGIREQRAEVRAAILRPSGAILPHRLPHPRWTPGARRLHFVRVLCAVVCLPSHLSLLCLEPALLLRTRFLDELVHAAFLPGCAGGRDVCAPAPAPPSLSLTPPGAFTAGFMACLELEASV